MTEHDLFAFQRCNREIERLVDLLRETAGRLASPRSCDFNAIPGGAGLDEHFHKILDERKTLEEKLKKCAAERVVAEARLDRVYALIVEDLTRDVFNLLYRKGKRVAEIQLALHYSHTHIYTQRKIILDLIKDLSA